MTSKQLFARAMGMAVCWTAIVTMNGCDGLNENLKSAELYLHNAGDKAIRVDKTSGLFTAYKAREVKPGDTLHVGRIKKGPQKITIDGKEQALEIAGGSFIVRTVGGKACWAIGKYNALYGGDGDKKVKLVGKGQGEHSSMPRESLGFQMLLPTEKLPEKRPVGTSLFRLNRVDCGLLADDAKVIEAITHR